MALFKPLLVGQLSGSVGANTFSHNASGDYIRQRKTPTNPGTVQQGVVRQAMGQLAALWGNTLTQVQREAWATYAANVTLLNRIGEAINVSGLNMYQRSNIVRIQNGLVRVDDGPTIFNLGDFTAPTIASFTTPTALSLNFNEADAWVGEDDAAMLLQGARNQSETINFFKGPYRVYAGQILGQVLLPETSPFAGTAPFPVSAGNKAFIRVSVTRADGRLSEDQRLEILAV